MVVETMKNALSVAPERDRAALRALAGRLDALATAQDRLHEAVRGLKALRPYYTWLGVYLLEGDTLVLGPYLGRPTEHVRIPIGAGICGLAARTKQIVNVADVTSDPRYLVCSLETRSELVAPIIAGDAVLGEIDIDSDMPAAFTVEDERLMQAAANLLASALLR